MLSLKSNLLLVPLDGPLVVDEALVVLFGGALAMHCWICKTDAFCFPILALFEQRVPVFPQFAIICFELLALAFV